MAERRERVPEELPGPGSLSGKGEASPGARAYTEAQPYVPPGTEPEPPADKRGDTGARGERQHASENAPGTRADPAAHAP